MGQLADFSDSNNTEHVVELKNLIGNLYIYEKGRDGVKADDVIGYVNDVVANTPNISKDFVIYYGLEMDVIGHLRCQGVEVID